MSSDASPSKNRLEILTVWPSIQQIIDILNHDYPQNRISGDYMSLHQDPGKAVWYDHDVESKVYP